MRETNAGWLTFRIARMRDELASLEEDLNNALRVVDTVPEKIANVKADVAELEALLTQPDPKSQPLA